jgi:NADH:ubiquinone oxidoreductase subunit F (NADH-binding)
MEDGRGELGDLEVLELQSHFNALGHTFCALAPNAVEPLQSALKHFGRISSGTWSSSAVLGGRPWGRFTSME